MSAAVLYVSYDGVLEPLGESQVVSYLERLAGDYDITLLSFEKPADAADAARMSAMSARLAAKGVSWVPLRYHKWPPVLSTVFDTLAGIARARKVVRAKGVTIVHARGYMPSLIALGSRGASGARFLFDMRGFWVDEKVEAGHWAAGGLLFRAGKWWERRFYAVADAVVSLTATGVRSLPELGVTMAPGVAVDVIPTCADLQRFSPGPKDLALAERLGVAGSPVIGCVGTMGNWYMRDEIIRSLAIFTKSWRELKILLVTRENHAALAADLEAAGVPRDRLTICSAPFEDMPRYIRLFDAGLFFITPSFSKRASAATKLAEFLGCGVPVLINDGVGDSGTIVRDGRVGVVLPTVDSETLAAAVAQLRSLVSDPGVGARCRSVAKEVFDLDTGVERYRGIYQRLIAR